MHVISEFGNDFDAYLHVLNNLADSLCHVPPDLSEDRRFRFNMQVERSRVCHIAYDKINKKVVPHE